jgi:RimJ/RimL family protein N-acetyltransferase
MDDGIRVSVTEPAAVPDATWQTDWSSHLLTLHPRRVRETLRHPAWRHRVVVATLDSEVAGLIPVSRPVGTAFSADIFDPRVRAPGLLDPRAAARDYLLIGGHFDLASGCAVRRGLPPPLARQIRCRVVAAAFALAKQDGLAGVALYVTDAEQAEWPHPLPPLQTAEYASIELAEPTRAAYLASLRHSRRSVVVRDERELDRLGLRAQAVVPQAVLGEAVPLVAAVKARHDAIEPAEFASYRLGQWSQAGAGTAIAFALRDQGGELLAVSFGRHDQDTVEMYEIGLRSDSPDRRLGYAEVLVYAPLRYAFEYGCRRLRLGCESIHPKQLRGATVAPLWAIGQELSAISPAVTAFSFNRPRTRS